jgi:anti-sigma regulatory factor (Ser/Thr protein kinase)
VAGRALRVPPRTDALAGVRRTVTAWADGAGLPDAAARRLVLAVDETLANAIEHGMDGAADGRISVRAVDAPGGLTVAVSYRGARFDPTSAPVPSPADALRARAVHGYGVHLLRRLADEVAFRYRAGRNEVRLTVRR